MCDSNTPLRSHVASWRLWGECSVDFCDWKMLSRMAEECSLAGRGHTLRPLRDNCPDLLACRVPGPGESSNSLEHHCTDGETEAGTGCEFPGCFTFPWTKHPTWKVLRVKTGFLSASLQREEWERALLLLEPAQCLAHRKCRVHFARLPKNDSPKLLVRALSPSLPLLQTPGLQRQEVILAGAGCSFVLRAVLPR